MRAPKGTPTGLNLWVLARYFASADEVPNQIEATSVPHLRRCLKAGLIEVNRAAGTLRLTDAGRAARDAEIDKAAAIVAAHTREG